MNVQKLIIEGVKERLFFNDYLVLPDFGGFVLKSRPSHISASGFGISPPAKTVSFNAQLKQNDGILVLWLQEKLKCTSSEALTHLKEFAIYCSELLKAKRRLSIEGLGFFYLNFENNVCFEPQQDVNFLSNSFGLGSLTIQPIEAEPKETEKPPVFVDRTLIKAKEVTQAIPGKKRNYRKLIFPVLLMLLFFSGLLLFIANTKMRGDLKATLFGTESGKGNYSPLSYPDISLVQAGNKDESYLTDVNGIASIRLDEDKSIYFKATDNVSVINSSHKNEKTFTKKGGFEIVLGCFTLAENAKKMVRKMATKNIDAEISGKNYKGMHVVSIVSFPSKEGAMSRLSEIKETCPHAWIKKVE